MQAGQSMRPRGEGARGLQSCVQPVLRLQSWSRPVHLDGSLVWEASWLCVAGQHCPKKRFGEQASQRRAVRPACIELGPDSACGGSMPLPAVRCQSVCGASPETPRNRPLHHLGFSARLCSLTQHSFG